MSRPLLVFLVLVIVSSLGCQQPLFNRHADRGGCGKSQCGQCRSPVLGAMRGKHDGEGMLGKHDGGGLLGKHGGGGLRGKKMGAKMAHHLRNQHGRPPHVPRLPQAPPYAGQMGPPSGTVAYPYYTTRGPRDFLLDNPPSIGY